MIGYYVHHRGEGHAARALTIADRFPGPVTGLSSRARPSGWEGEWVRLSADEGPARYEADPTVGGALHWAPAHHPGLRHRMAQLASWIDAARPRLLVVDVSVEVAVFARLIGVPVAVMAMPGIRTDDPHQLAFRIASVIVAPWPSWTSPMTGGRAWDHKLRCVGALSRFDGRPAPKPPAHGRRRVVVLSGRGGTALGANQIADAARATPAWDWEVLGGPSRWEPDPWTALARADVVVTHAGQNAVAEVAASRRPAIVIPQDRPHGEQRATARELGRAGLALVRTRWPSRDQWPELLASAARMDGERWSRWSDGRGGDRAARLLASVSNARGEDRACA